MAPASSAVIVTWVVVVVLILDVDVVTLCYGCRLDASALDPEVNSGGILCFGRICCVHNCSARYDLCSGVYLCLELYFYFIGWLIFSRGCWGWMLFIMRVVEGLSFYFYVSILSLIC